MRHKDRNLLFGILAVQLRRVTPAQLVTAAAKWAVEPDKEIAAFLREADVLSQNDVHLLNQFVDAAIAAHHGDAEATLTAFGGNEQLLHSFAGCVHRTRDGNLEIQVSPEARGEWDGASSTVQEAPGRYSEFGVHGHGGMGRVLLVYDAFLGRDIALKELLPEICPNGPDSPARIDTPLMARFLQEARITGQLEHPAVVPVYELGRRSNGNLYYTMKFVRGRTLDAALTEAKTLENRLRMLPHFVALCNAVAYAHNRSVIHRDIKPANIMVGEFGETVVLDWGLAKCSRDRDAHREDLEQTFHALYLGDTVALAKTRYGQAIGTPMYMSPEQARGQIDLVDERSDVYALGAVLYVYLTGQAPYNGGNLKEVLDKVIQESPTPVRTLEQDAPEELISICKRAMAKEPANRYASARELAAEVERFLSGALVDAYHYKLSERLARFIRKHRLVLLSGATALLLIIAVSAFYNVRLYQAHGSEQAARFRAEETREVAETARAQADQSAYYASIGLAERCVEQRQYDQARLALAECPPHLRNWEWGFLQAACHHDVMTIRAHEGPVNALAVTPDGRLAATGTIDGIITVWDCHTAQQDSLLSMIPLWTKQVHTEAVSDLAFSHDGKRLASSSVDDTVILLNASDGQVVNQLMGHQDNVYTVQFSPDDALLLTSSADGTARIWNLTQSSQSISLTPHEGQVLATAWHPRGEFIVTDGYNDPVRFWNPASGECIKTLEQPSAIQGDAVAFSPDGKEIALASTAVTIIDAATTEIVRTIDLRAYESFTTLAYSPDSIYLAAAGSDRRIWVWRAATGELAATFAGHSSYVNRIVFLPDSSTVLSASDDGTIKCWDFGAVGQRTLHRERSGAVNVLAFSLNGALLATASEDGTACLWDADSGKLNAELRGHEGAVLAATFSPDGRTLATGGVDQNVILWDTATGNVRTKLEQDNHAMSLAFSPDGRQLAVGTGQWPARGKTPVAIWDMNTNTCLIRLQQHEGAVYSVAFSPDGKTLATGGSDRMLRLWDTALWRKTAEFAGPRAWEGLAFSTDGHTLAAGCRDYNLYVFDLATGQPVHVLRGHGAYVHDIVFGLQDSRLMTAAGDGTIRLWDALAGRELISIEGHGGSVASVDFSVRHNMFASCSSDGLIRLWTAFPWQGPDIESEARLESYNRRYWKQERSRNSAWANPHGHVLLPKQRLPLASNPSMTEEFSINHSIILDTVAVNDIRATMATVSGRIVNTGGGAITEYGVCWSTTDPPTIDGPKTPSIGHFDGTYTLAMNGLQPATEYFVRAYAVNEAGDVGYGQSNNFRTADKPPIELPTVTIYAAPLEITSTSGKIYGTLEARGGTVSESGVWYSDNDSDPRREKQAAFLPGVQESETRFYCVLSSLKPDTTYYVRGYVKTEAGETYGEPVIKFKTAAVVTAAPTPPATPPSPPAATPQQPSAPQVVVHSTPAAPAPAPSQQSGGAWEQVMQPPQPARPAPVSPPPAVTRPSPPPPPPPTPEPPRQDGTKFYRGGRGGKPGW